MEFKNGKTKAAIWNCIKNEGVPLCVHQISTKTGKVEHTIYQAIRKMLSDDQLVTTFSKSTCNLSSMAHTFYNINKALDNTKKEEVKTEEPKNTIDTVIEDTAKTKPKQTKKENYLLDRLEAIVRMPEDSKIIRAINLWYKNKSTMSEEDFNMILEVFNIAKGD